MSVEEIYQYRKVNDQLITGGQPTEEQLQRETPMQTTVHGIHHVTAVAGDAQQNLDFYVGVLGMRMVKKSVNQDAPHIYHLFYADGAGTPGTDITFFPWPDIAPTPGRVGIGLTVEVPFAIRQV